MKVYGYSEMETNLLSLSQLTIQANPHQLRALATFILNCANQMENDENWEHAHFLDECKSTQTEHDIIIFRDLE